MKQTTSPSTIQRDDIANLICAAYFVTNAVGYVCTDHLYAVTGQSWDTDFAARRGTADDPDQDNAEEILSWMG